MHTVTTGSGFGSSNTATPFGANRTGFGGSIAATSGGSLFGGNATATAPASSGFGGFGSNNANTGGGLFGSNNKPAFGAQNNTGGSLFGGASGTNTFGQPQNQTGSGFGNSLGSALGTNTTECQGTGSTPFQAFQEKDAGAGSASVMNHFQSICCMPPYKNFSYEV